MGNSQEKKKAKLVLADGTIFSGKSIGASGETFGEVVFNTSMSGYQEILTDPSYAGQMLTFTCPHIGNVGVNSEDVESNRPHVSGLIVRDLSEHHSNYRSQQSLQDYLVENNIVGISGIDTRALVLHLRTYGAQMGVISTMETGADVLLDKVKSLPSMEGKNLVPSVSTKVNYSWKQGVWSFNGTGLNGGGGYRELNESELSGRPHVVAIDFGIKYNILRLLTAVGCRVTVVPWNTSAGDILALNPQGVFLSNGPGDPAAVDEGIQTVKALVGKKPIFGICLGHQILGLALGAPTFKLKFGHRGGNHPVRNEITKKVEITVQNHGFATDAKRVPKGLTISHINLNDGTVEGFDVPEKKAFSVQYHPESSPGPHDAMYLFKKFYENICRDG